MYFLHLFTTIICIVSSQANPIDVYDDDYFANLTIPHPDPSRFIGDILLPEGTAKIGAIDFDKYPGSKWQKNVVPYRISLLSYTPSQRTQIETGIKALNKRLKCVQFTPAGLLDTDFLFIFSGNGCYSNLGRMGGMQNVSLQRNGCLSVGTIQHQLMHASGLIHENNRPDRDNYVKVLWENIPTEWRS